MDAPTAQKGWARWAFVDGMLGWGVPVALGTWVFEVWVHGKDEGAGDLVLRFCVFMAGGVLWGLGMKWWSDRKRRPVAN